MSFSSRRTVGSPRPSDNFYKMKEIVRLCIFISGLSTSVLSWGKVLPTRIERQWIGKSNKDEGISIPPLYHVVPILKVCQKEDWVVFTL